MKRVLAFLLVCVMICGGLVGCSDEAGPSGTYTPGDGLIYLTFDGANAELHMGQLTAKGTWKIKDGVVTITYDNNAGEKSYEYNADNDTLKTANDEIMYRVEE